MVYLSVSDLYPDDNKNSQEEDKFSIKKTAGKERMNITSK